MELADSKCSGRAEGSFMCDLCCFPLVHFFSSRLPALQDVRQEEELFNLSQAAAKAHLSSIHTNQVLHKTLAQTSLCCQIVSASNAPSALLPLLDFCFCFFLVMLPTSWPASFGCDLVYCVVSVREHAEDQGLCLISKPGCLLPR